MTHDDPGRPQRLLRLARAAVAGYEELRTPEALDTALRSLREALGGQDPEGPDAALVHELIGDLSYERYELGGRPQDIDACVDHYREALRTAPPGSDLPLLRFALGNALMDRGRAAADRDQLAQALEMFGQALAGAGAEEGEEPGWCRHARVRGVFVRALLWWHFDDQTQPGPAEAELKPILAGPDALDDLTPQLLDAFGRLLYERAAQRDDDAGRDRAIGLLREAFRRWEPEHDGPVGPAALQLALLEQARYRQDKDTDRLPVVAEAAALARDGGLVPDARGMAVVVLAWARGEMVQRGTAEEDEGLQELSREARDAYMELARAVQEGRTSPNLDDSQFGALVNDLAGGSRLTEGLHQLFAQWEAMEPGSREHGTFAGHLLGNLPMLDPHGTHVSARQRQALTEAALAVDQDNATWQAAVRSMAAGQRIQSEAAGDGAGLDEALRQLDEARALTGEHAELRDGTDMFRWFASFTRGQLHDGRDDLDSAVDDWERMRDSPVLTPYMRRMMDGQNAGLQAHRAHQQGDLPGVDRGLAVLRELYASLPDDDTSRIEVWTMLDSLHVKRSDLARRLGAAPAAPLTGRPTTAELRRQAAALPRDHHAWVLGSSGISLYQQAGQSGDMRRLDEAMVLVQDALKLAEDGSDDWLRYAYVLGTGHCARASVLPHERRRSLDTGIGWLEKAHRLAAGPGHRLWAVLGVTLGRAYRERGGGGGEDRRRGRHVGLDALRGHAWAVLLQSGTGHAAEAAAQATETALEVAGWCLADGAPEEAVAALDACRGLVLHAATTSRSVPDLLIAAGRGELAERWRAAGGESAPDAAAWDGDAATGVPSELRRAVLAALTGPDGAAAGLLEPPEPEGIGEALRSVRADVLAYLMPGQEGRGGWAVLVDAGGGVHSVPLPALREEAPALAEYAAVPGAGVRDMGPAWTGAAPGVSLRKRLDRLCGWAWYAAVKPLLETVGRPPSGRRPRLVLVPMGALGVVPWHAAWSPGDAEGSARAYAVQEAEISYAASARLLCEVAARPAVTHGGAALVVGDPTGDLAYAGEEAAAVHGAFYRQGGFLGPGRAGTADVLGWLRDPGNAGGVLHLACHGMVAPNSRRSAYLKLYDGELSAEELTEATDGGDRGQLELVVLAACRSHVSGRGHNEAYSLATAFLVAGARSVLGSLWPVPDDATSVLMFMAHHYLRREGEPPGRALHRAQLWMLDPARRLPDDMPAALRQRAAVIDPDDLASWAGFTHLGR
ncbi:CHAT domain-containing protein [Streptomyces sp. NPDC053079]|uniref:CHAT domain-containing protein n=1 Tax=Streptomyces sp. NPDC053079 TaxID=3365697 RepID=UPI0037D2CED0